jgi:hypothetical protein
MPTPAAKQIELIHQTPLHCTKTMDFIGPSLHPIRRQKMTIDANNALAACLVEEEGDAVA